MSFLTSKAGPSHLNNTNHHDQILASSSQYNPAQPSTSSSQFRSGNNNVISKEQDHNHNFEDFTRGQSSSILSLNNTSIALSQPSLLQSSLPSSTIDSQYQKMPLHLPAISSMDGSEVSALFNDPSGHDEVYHDDLVAGSMSYRSYQHQSDRQHSLSELEKQRQRKMEEWILTDDIIAYIKKQDSTYVDDIYGLPPAIAQLVKEAKEEISQNQNGDGTDGHQKAVSRLQMIRDHLIGRSQGNCTLAIQQGLQMKSDDWASFF